MKEVLDLTPFGSKFLETRIQPAWVLLFWKYEVAENHIDSIYLAFFDPLDSDCEL